MEYYELHPDNPQQRYIKKAVETIKNGGIIIYPTDTVYGLGCDIFNKEAVERIYMIKNETDRKLFSFICSDFKVPPGELIHLLPHYPSQEAGFNFKVNHCFNIESILNLLQYALYNHLLYLSF